MTEQGQQDPTAHLFIGWGGEFHNPAWQVCFSVSITSGQTTVLDLMNDAAGGSCTPAIEFEYEGSGASAYLTSIDGVAADSDYGWAYFVNGGMPDVGFAAYELNAGDTVVWLYIHSSSGLRQATAPRIAR